MDKVDEIGWCIASALKATQRLPANPHGSLHVAHASLYWPFAELLDEGCSFIDFVCMLCSALRAGRVRNGSQATSILGHIQMKAEIA